MAWWRCWQWEHRGRRSRRSLCMDPETVFCNISPVPLLCWVLHGSNDFQVAFPRLPGQLASSWVYPMGSTGWRWNRQRKREVIFFSFTLSVLGCFSRSSCLSSWTLDPARQLWCGLASVWWPEPLSSDHSVSSFAPKA